MDRRSFFRLIPGAAAAAVLAGSSVALAMSALPTPERLPAFMRKSKLYQLWGMQEFNGTTFETWKTPNGYVHIGPLKNPTEENLQWKYDVIVWYDEQYCHRRDTCPVHGPGMASVY